MEHELIARAREGDRDAMEQLLTRVAPRIERFGMRMCRHPQDAQDVMQDTLLNVATHLSEFRGEASLLSWVFTLARSACSRRRRGLKNRPHEDIDGVRGRAAGSPSPEERAEGRQLVIRVQDALDALPVEHREVILLRDVEGLSAAEAADSLGISVAALKSRLHRARAALRDGLEALLVAEPVRAQSGCPDVAELWSKKLEGELHADDCARMEAHLARCGTCGEACETLKAALSACQRMADPIATPQTRARVREALDAWAAEQR